MDLSDLRKPQHLKIVSLVALCLLGLIVIRDFLTWWEILDQLQIPVIPQSFVRWQAKQFLYAGLITFCVVMSALFYWRLQKYPAAFIISVIGLLGHFIYFQYFRY